MDHPPPIPIVFIHQGTASYLPYSLLQVKRTNPESPIYLLGDWGGVHFSGLVKHFPVSRYWIMASELANNFVNFSTNPHNFELVCLQRWMVLLEFMKAEKLGHCVYLDSDILVYGHLGEEQMKFKDYGMTVAGISGHTNFVSDVGVLDAFCHFILDSYTKLNALDILEEKYFEFRKNNPAGGISDMTFFTEFREHFPGQVLDISQVWPDESTFDITVQYTKGYSLDSGHKKVVMKFGQPYCFLMPEGHPVRFNTLHFQGEAKQWMPLFFTGDSRKLKFLKPVNSVFEILVKIKNKLKKYFSVRD